MRKLLLSAMMLAVCATAQADINIGDKLKDVAVNQGIIYSIKDSEISHVSTAELINKWGTSLEAGYSDNGKLVGVISYKLLDAKDFISTPLLKELEFKPGVYYAWDELGNDTKGDYGLSLTMLQVSW